MPQNPRRVRFWLAAVPAVLAACAPAWGQGGGGSNVAATKHNLTSSGPGPIRIGGQVNVCRPCHTPHASNPIAPLWNRNDPGTDYRPYFSSTLVARVGQPTGSSRLCLSCHDGTIALSQTYNPLNAPTGTVYIMPTDKGHLGTDLSDDHPVSFLYDPALAALKGQLRDPLTLPRELALDKNRQLQCTTCHDPHDNRNGKFLTMANTEGAMCQSCHQINNWVGSSHSLASASLARSVRDRWDNVSATTVRAAACESCHRPHNAGGRPRLLRHEAGLDNCLPCHDGTVASKNLVGDLAKISRHPMSSYTGLHDEAEKPGAMPKHVECVDCHNPHKALAGTAPGAPAIKPTMRGASGVNADGQFLPEAINEYEVCFKCHAGSNPVRAPLVDRWIVSTNCADEFNPLNPSFHPVETQGKNPNVPSLLLPLRTTSKIYCTDCHSSDSSTGARGPHGSAYTPLLVKQYLTADYTAESPDAYALCYTCHDRNSIVNDRSFPMHRKHVVDKKAPCSACHDAHGLSAATSTSASGACLINFDRRIVSPLTAGTTPSFNHTGKFRGSCTLRCHNESHNNFSYSGSSSTSTLKVLKGSAIPAPIPVSPGKGKKK